VSSSPTGVHSSKDLPGYWSLEGGDALAQPPRKGIGGPRGYFPTPLDAALVYAREVYCQQAIRDGRFKQPRAGGGGNSAGHKAKSATAAGKDAAKPAKPAAKPKESSKSAAGAASKREREENPLSEGTPPEPSKKAKKAAGGLGGSSLVDRIVAGVEPLESLGTNRVVTKEMLQAQFISMASNG